MGVSWWVSGLLGASDGWLVAPTNTNTSNRPPTFQCESMRISAIPLLKVGVWVMKYKNQYPRRNNKYVCAKKSPTIPNEKKQQRCTSTTIPSANKICSFYDDVLYILLLYGFALNIFPSWKRWVELKLSRAGHRRKRSARSERRKRKHALCWCGRDCRRGIWRGLPAVLKTLGNTTLAT